VPDHINVMASFDQVAQVGRFCFRVPNVRDGMAGNDL
jgi:hypothetical protein